MKRIWAFLIENRNDWIILGIILFLPSFCGSLALKERGDNLRIQYNLNNKVEVR